MRYVMSEHVVGEVVERAGRGSQVGPMLANLTWTVVSFKGSAGHFPDGSVQVGVRLRAVRPCQRVDGIRLMLPELPLPQYDCPTAARRPDGRSLTSGECPAPRQQQVNR